MIKNDLEYIQEMIKKKYSGKYKNITDLSFLLSKDLQISIPTCWRLLKQEDFTFSKKTISAINKAFPDWDWNKVYIN